MKVKIATDLRSRNFKDETPLAQIKENEMKKKQERKNVLSNKYQSLIKYQYFLNLFIVLYFIGGMLLFMLIIGSLASGSEIVLTLVLGFVLICIGVWVLLQTKDMIDFLFDLAEEKADISHKH